MPLCIRGSYDVDDLSRSEILLKTLTRFAEPSLIQQFCVVVPDAEVDIVRERYGDRWQHLNLEVISEEALLPELKSHQKVRGWRKQQLIKLAAPRIIKSKFVITFDADVICLKPLTEEKLLPEGRGLLQFENRSQHPKWWRSSSKILAMDANVGDPELGMSVTPAIMSTELTLALTEELSSLTGKNWVHALCSLHNPKDFRNWRISRYLQNKWTEYSLYYLFSHKVGKFNQYHITAGTENTPQVLLIHDSHPFETWSPAKNFSDECPGLFCVVGSKTFLEPAVVWDKIKPFVE